VIQCNEVCTHVKNMVTMSAIAVDDPDKLVRDLEQQELEAAGGVPAVGVYSQLLALYLLQNDLCSAKFLWKRIPSDIKAAHEDLEHIWALGQKMWQRDLPAIYECLQREWPDRLKPTMHKILESVRKRTISVVSNAYSSISAQDFSMLVGLSKEKALEVATENGWTYNTEKDMILPKKPPEPSSSVTPSEQQLQRLTEFVSFLEN